MSAFFCRIVFDNLLFKLVRAGESGADCSITPELLAYLETELA